MTTKSPWAFRTRMLPWALLNAVAVGVWMQSPGIGTVTFSIWWLVVWCVQEICEVLERRETQ